MKKIYLISSLLVLIGILAGISFFLIRDANAKIPPEITLTTQNNKAYTFGKNHTKMKLVEFIYTHCTDICPTTTQKMVHLKNKLQKSGMYGKDIQFITISIDPYRDTPEVMKKYMNMFLVPNDGNWVFLTGTHATIKTDLKSIRAAASSLQFQFTDPGNGFFIHSTFMYLLDENNKFIQKFPMGDQFNEKKVYDSILKDLQ